MVTRKHGVAFAVCGFLALPALSGDEVLYSRREIAGQTYIQSERVVFQRTPDATATEWMLAAGGGTSSLVFRIIPQEGPWYPYLQQYDQWNRPLHPTLELDPVLGDYTHIIDAEKLGDRACVCWSRDCGMGVQVLSAAGAPFSGAFCPAPELRNYYGSRGIALERERVVLYFDGTYENGDSVQYGVFLAATDWAGGASSGVITIAANDGNPRNHGVSIAELSDYSTAVVWTEGVWKDGQASRIMYRRTLSDFSLTEAVELVPGPQVGGRTMHALDNDDLLLIYEAPPERRLYAQRFAMDGAAVTESHALPYDHISSSIWLDIARDGRFIVFSQVSDSMSAQLFGADFEPQGDKFPLSILEDARPNGVITQPVQFDDDGSIAWVFLTDSPTRVWNARATPFLPGDMNRDGVVNNFDIDAFVLAIADLPAYSQQFDIPEPAALIIGDVNSDGLLNNFDIDPFVALLAGG